MLRVGPNPYGLCCTLGLQGHNSEPRDLDWYLKLAEDMGAKCIEFHFGHVSDRSQDTLETVKKRLESAAIEPIISGPWPLERLIEAFPIAKALGARTVRTHLTPVLCGARAEQGEHWSEMVANIQVRLKELGPFAVDEGLVIAIENHQDFGSRELLEFCEIGGDGIGICLDTGNPLAVGEDPAAFARRVSKKVRHLHLKDYRAQRTTEGYRLVRCAIGDGAVPLTKIAEILGCDHPELTASLEPGALNSRHIKLLTDEWKQGYPPSSLEEIEECFNAIHSSAIPPEDDWRTPWEKEDKIEETCNFEVDQMMKSVQNMRTIGWLPK